VIDRAGEHARQLGRADTLLHVRDLRLRLGDGRGVVSLGAQLEERLAVLEIARELLGLLDQLLQRRSLAADRLRLLGVVPEAGRQLLGAELVDLALQLRKVKDAPLAP
jgi:hypothetical protein